MFEHQPGPHVAVIEDDDLERDALGRLLQAGGFDADLFPSAETFIAAGLGRSWLCLVIDVNLTGMSGIDLQRKLRADGSDVPIIITTGKRTEVIRESAQQAGCVDVLWKPFHADAILTLVAGLADRPTT